MPGILTGPASDKLQSYFIPAVCVLIFFLGYTSQWLFNTAEYLEPGPLTQRETTIFNILLACVWWTYYKACVVPPGRYVFRSSEDKKPSSEHVDDSRQPSSPSSSSSSPPSTEHPAIPMPITETARWCKKCAAPKPLRAHHCKHCRTCIPKMDHHCPWTANCVSLQTFPYFLRFLFYTNLALWYFLSWLLYPRFRYLFWDNSRLPSYLGPSIPVMVHLVLLGMFGGLASLALGILLVTTIRGWVLNQTMIEGWEAERHEAVLLRHKKGGWWTNDDDDYYGRPHVRIERVEFPYDLGFFDNMAQAMGTRNILSWLDPFVGGGPIVNNKEVGKGTGWEWEENGFNDREGMWPPLDPDKLRRSIRKSKWPGSAAARSHDEAAFVHNQQANPRDEVAAFRARQEMDLRRRTGRSGVIAELNESQDLGDLEEDDEYDYVDRDSAYGAKGGDYYSGNNKDKDSDDDEDDEEEDEEEEDEGNIVPPVRGRPYFEHGADGEPGWTNSEGDRLRDYGVDEEAEDDDEDVPLGELLRRRRGYGSSNQ